MRAYAGVEPDVRLLRRSVGLSRPAPAVVRVHGEHASAALDRVLPGEVWLRDGQIRPTVLLRPDGTVQADVLLACDGDDWLLFADGVDAGALTALLAGAAVEDLGPSHRTIAIDGPFAWALLGAWDEAGAIGLPYLTLYHRDQVRVLRAGKTGEYGYTFLTPADQADDLVRTLLTLGERFGVRPVSEDAVAYCALESGFLDLAALPSPADPRELQLQWRISAGKRCLGSEGLAARPWTRRMTAFRSTGTGSVGAVVRCDGEAVGELAVVAPEVGGTGVLGLALLDRALAVSGIELPADGGPIRTVSQPMIRNRSLYVRPQRHTWADEPGLPYPYP